MDLYNFTFENIGRVFGTGPTDASTVILFFVLSFLVGMVTLSWVYLLEYRKNKERILWSGENLINKIFLSTLVGIVGYVTIVFFKINLDLINPTNIPMTNFFWIFAAIIYSTQFLSFLRKKEVSYLKDIKKFAEQNMFIWMTMTISMMAILFISKFNQSKMLKLILLSLAIFLAILLIAKENRNNK